MKYYVETREVISCIYEIESEKELTREEIENSFLEYDLKEIGNKVIDAEITRVTKGA